MLANFFGTSSIILPNIPLISNLLVLNNIGTLHWHYNNTLNQLTKTDKSNTTQYYVYDYQGNRVRTVIESDNNGDKYLRYKSENK
jgi:hypothetical protein